MEQTNKRYWNDQRSLHDRFKEEYGVDYAEKQEWADKYNNGVVIRAKLVQNAEGKTIVKWGKDGE